MDRRITRVADAAVEVLAARRQLAEAEAGFAEACIRAHAAGVPKTQVSGRALAVLRARGVDIPPRSGFGCSSVRNIIDGRPAEPPA